MKGTPDKGAARSVIRVVEGCIMIIQSESIKKGGQICTFIALCSLLAVISTCRQVNGDAENTIPPNDEPGVTNGSASAEGGLVGLDDIQLTTRERGLAVESASYTPPFAGWLHMGIGHLVSYVPAGSVLRVDKDPSGEAKWRMWRIVTPAGEMITLRMQRLADTTEWSVVSVSARVLGDVAPPVGYSGSDSILVRGYYWGMSREELSKLADRELSQKEHCLSVGLVQLYLSERVEWSERSSDSAIGTIESWVGKARYVTRYFFTDSRLERVQWETEWYDAFKGDHRLSPPELPSDRWDQWSMESLLDVGP